MEGERRIFERFSAKFPAKFKDSLKGYDTDVFLRDASAAGARIASRERLLLDDSVSLEVEVPDGGEPMVLQGRVTWSKAGQMNLWEAGVQLNEPNFMKMRRLFQFTLEA